MTRVWQEAALMRGAHDEDKQRRRAQREASEAQYRRAVLVATGKTLPPTPSPAERLWQQGRRARAPVGRLLQ